MKLYKIFDKVYRVDIRLMIGTADELEKYARKYDDNYEDVPEASGRTFRFPHGGILIWLKKFDTIDPDDYGLLSHELVHAASLVFDDRKMRYWVAYSEMLAYYVGYLTKEFLEKLFKDDPCT